MQKGFCPKQGKSLKNLRFLGLVASQGGTISSARKHVFEKECCKSVAKTVARKVPNPERRINTGFFSTSKPKGTTPTLLQYSPTPYFQCVFLSFQAFLRAFFYVVFYLSSLVLQKVLQLLQRNDTTRF